MKPISRRLYAFAAIVLAAIVFVAINIAADTGSRPQSSISRRTASSRWREGTRNIIANLKEPITLQFYFSKEVAAEYAQTAAYAKRVRDLLGEYAALSHGKIILEEVDPEPFTAGRRRSDRQRPDRRADRQRRRGLFRPRRHQPDRRQGSHSLFHARSRAISRIRSLLADLSPVDAEEAGASASSPACRSRPAPAACRR